MTSSASSASSASSSSSAAFERLHPSIQHHVVNSLGWPRLRPLQDAAVDPVLAGDHALLLAPTAGGKTEAALFPVLSRIATERRPAPSTLYLCPLRALLNDLLPRLERYAGWTGHRVGVWHGDVGPGARRRLLVDPPDILLTTPESLEAMLLSTRVDSAGFFARLRAVVVDEVHAFAGDDRGWHLLAVLARLERLAGRALQRIGLSATVGNPEALLTWLTPGADGSADRRERGRRRRVVDPRTDRGATSPAGGPAGDGAEVTIDHVGSLANAATVIAGLHHGEKRLVFVDSRARAEKLTQELRAKGVTTFVSHASLGRDQRRQAEAAFAERTNCVIVATSTLELGIDIGDLDRIVQIDAPGTVASFLQRLGRSGRRAGGPPRNTLFLATRPEALWLAAGIARLWQQAWVEPVVPPPRPLHLVAHQLLALVLQEGAVGRDLWTEWLGEPNVLGDDVAVHADTVRDHLLAEGFLHEDGGMLSVGTEAEAQLGRRNFLELTSVFTAPPLFTVLAGRREVGHVHDLSLLAAFGVRDGTPPVLLLGGRGWRILDVDWRRRRVQVELTEATGRTHYRGAGRLYGYELCQSVGAVLGGASPGVALSRRATDALTGSRASFPGLSPGEATLITVDAGSADAGAAGGAGGGEAGGGGRTTWWTFAGLRANLELAARLGPLRGSVRTIGGLSIPLAAGTTADGVAAALDRTTPLGDLLDLADEMTEGVKLADCLPRDLADQIVLARLTDPTAVEQVLARRIDTAHVDR